VNTLLPYPSFSESAHTLDSVLLKRQRIDVLTILRVLGGDEEGWWNHPAVRMWDGYEQMLVCYGVEICKEWRRRGHKDTGDIEGEVWAYGIDTCLWECDVPGWLGGHVHSNHRSNLLRLDGECYRKFNWAEYPTESGWYWPRTRRDR